MATLMKRNAVNMSGIGNIRIVPGTNRFTDEQMEELKANPAFDEMIAATPADNAAVFANFVSLAILFT